MHLTLPGGLVVGDTLLRRVSPRAVSGQLELLLADAMLTPQPWPRFVSELLGLAFLGADGQPWGEPQAAALCMGDRQYLLLHLAKSLWGDGFWVSARCVRCAESFDLKLERSRLPMKPAGPGYPVASLTVGERQLRLRLPTGLDEMELCDAPDERLLEILVSRCLDSVDGRPATAADVAALDDAALARIDTALETLSPELGLNLSTHCLACGCEQVVAFDPFGFDQLQGHSLLDEIHSLASHYHWSEADIVSLPRTRRRHYLQRIDAAQGQAA